MSAVARDPQPRSAANAAAGAPGEATAPSAPAQATVPSAPAQATAEAGPGSMGADGARRFPARLGVLPLRDAVTFPELVMPLNIGQPRSIALINDVLRGDRSLVLVAGKDPEVEAPGPDQVHDVGVLGTVVRMVRLPDNTLRVLVQGGERVRVLEWVATEPYLVALVQPAPDRVRQSDELQALARNVQRTFSEIAGKVPYLPEELQVMVANIEDPVLLSHLIAGALRLPTAEKQKLLEELDVTRRLRRLSELLAREAQLVALDSKIETQVQSELEKGQREFFLRQRLKAIQEELGEGDEARAEAAELRAQLEALTLPEEVSKQVQRELGRLERLQPAMAEYGVVRTYLEWIASLPWSTTTEDNLDLAHAREVLDADHYDIEQVKDRILEFLAVRSLTRDRGDQPAGSILTFVGPPGVGKTSLGRSVARALGRRFERISVGGVRDEAEIRGHRRTYIGAMPGVIIRAMRDAGARNPLFMIDEIDKLGSDFRGDPASAMLEVLDPEQNATFRDHYLDLPFDLSSVMFIATANTLDTIPGPLRDRMEVITLSGYTADEKLQIAKRYLVARQIERNGLTSARLAFTDAGLREIISGYTREAGVRQLEREIGAIARKVARQVAEGRAAGRTTVTAPRVRELLGRPRFLPEVRRRTSRPGVATGLAWTATGGEVLFVEATAMPGSGKLTITGQLGDVMRESAQAALSYVRANAGELAPGLAHDWFAKQDIHIHVPAGAVPKDGPSAGVTIVTALASLISGRPVRSDVAMTGEITLAGNVLPIGGLKEKALAAQRGGLRTVIAPALNEPDVEDIPEHLRKAIRFVFVSTIDEVLAAALRRRPAAGERGGSSPSAGAAAGPRRPAAPGRRRRPAAEHRVS
ncbi:MAG TPA: endopeptidase La [Solirubrobacteraceae bacterium]|nr:endopeptidase La [Solirubrobacteraceae bacterium]